LVRWRDGEPARGCLANFNQALLERDGGPKWGHPLRRKTGLEKPGQARLLYRRRLQFEPRGAARKEE